MNKYTHDLMAIAGDVSLTMLGTAFEPAPGAEPGRPGLTACVQINGEWQGAVLVQCSVGAASAITRLLLRTDDVEPADVRDALGEVANMIGGNVKALLPGPSRLSLPAVVEGYDHHVSVPGTVELTTVPFRFAGDVISVVLLGEADGSSGSDERRAVEVVR
jgi:chemotaxis protein CheX